MSEGFFFCISQEPSAICDVKGEEKIKRELPKKFCLRVYLN